MPNYITSLNQMIVSTVKDIPNVVLYGQNLNTGTYISGLSKNLAVPESGRIINTPNCENTLCGMGFGMMMAGVPCVYFVKQLDFMLLGLDHFVNTYNFIRCSRDPGTLGSFSIIQLLCDQGLQGPQSSFTSYPDFSSIARIPCYSLTNGADAARVLPMVKQPGFRMIGLSSRLCKSEFQTLNVVRAADDASILQYSEGDGATIVCFNFSLAEGLVLQKKMQERGLRSSLFQANYVPYPDWTPIQKSVAATRKLVVMDDSKSVHLPLYMLLDAIAEGGTPFRRVVVSRGKDVEFGMSDDKFVVNHDAILARLAG